MTMNFENYNKYLIGLLTWLTVVLSFHIYGSVI